ncbi:hypothetical protein [Rufibacter hautae]|uniref:AEC family transporter n=1 Tax=Rufibacter hautae TaxID=2595005 RepID=A0A5B6TEX5_9BACT|nr:hypothetical protein [Rufibacter hautae]KAA3438716.1 hypothetical protein FOA19_15970 [Rufibacter hautae]
MEGQELRVFYDDTIGYYLISRSKDLPVKKAALNEVKIPAVYACFAAVFANSMGFQMPETLTPVMDGASWVLSALGMVMIGFGLTKVNFREIAYKTFGKIMEVRYLATAAFLGLLLWAKMGLVGQLRPDEQKLLFLISAFPIAANLVVFSSFLDTEEENAALLVSVSSLISLVLVPVACVLLFK